MNITRKNYSRRIISAGFAFILALSTVTASSSLLFAEKAEAYGPFASYRLKTVQSGADVEAGNGNVDTIDVFAEFKSIGAGWNDFWGLFGDSTVSASVTGGQVSLDGINWDSSATSEINQFDRVMDTFYFRSQSVGSYSVSFSSDIDISFGGKRAPVTTAYLNSVDTTKPIITDVHTSPANLVNNNGSVIVSATDTVGLKKVSFTVEGTGSYGVLNVVGGAKSATLTKSFADLGLTDGTYTIKAAAEDVNGNYAVPVSVTVTVDNTAPSIVWQKQPAAYINNVFHVRPITTEVSTTKSVYLNTVDPANLCSTITSDHKNFDVKNVNCQVLLDTLPEGVHKFIAVFSDAAGNETVSSSSNFVIDRTAPTVKINLNRQSYLVNGGVTRSGAIPEIEANDANLDRIEVYKNGNKVTEWLATSSSRRAKINWLGEGTYVIKSIDKAGNISEEFGVTIDNTAPVASKIRVNGETVAGRYKHNENCSPINGLFEVSGSLNVTAVIDDTDTVSATYKVRKLDVNGCTRSNIYSSNTVSLKQNNKNASNWNQNSIFDTAEQELEGTYAIVLTVTDVAGNKSTKYVHINVANSPSPTEGEGQGNSGGTGDSQAGGATGGSLTIQALSQNGIPSQALVASALQAVSEVADSEETEVLGESTQNKTDGDNKEVLAATTTPEVKGASNFSLLGLAWYWWLLLIAALGAVWWFIAAWRRRQAEEA